MAHLLKVLTLVLALCASPAFAGYAQLKPPPGWSQGMGAAVPGQAGVFNYGSAANGSSWKGTTVLTNAALNVAGQMVTVPVSMRVAANAASVAAQWSFGNPYLFVAALAAPVAYKYWKDSGLWVKDGQWVKAGTNPWMIEGSSTLFESKNEACQSLSGSYVSNETSTFTFSVSGNSCSVTEKYHPKPPAQGKTEVVARHQVTEVLPEPGSPPLASKPATVTDFEKAIAAKPFPPLAIPELPIDWPIEQPVINPQFKPGVNPSPAPSPANQPQSEPLRVPVGEPQPVPNSNPKKWEQPAVDIVPAPTPQTPWRVDLQPKNVESDNPKGIKNPVSVPTPQPDPVTGETPQDPAKPNETPGLCDEYPDILACQKLGEVEAKDLKNKTVPLEIKRDEGWNMAQASCPAPKVLTLGGKPYSFEITPLCDFATGIKPLVVGFAWLSALLGFIGLSRKGD